MGSVYEAEHNATGRRVAVKLISSSDLTRDATVIGRFQREARAAGAIDTQHITQVLDAGVDAASGLPFLVMEFLTGEDLQHLLKRTGPIAPELALRIVAQSCLGLQKAHDANVVHRDIKPANLFLAKRDAGEIIVKLLDFGIAKVKMDQAHDTESAGLTKTGSMIGSPLYMSPEQARGHVKEIDHRTDIWSLGIVLYQALSGKTPYQHITALGQLILAICSEWPQHIQEAAPWVPAEVASIVHRCLRHNPAERYQTANEMFQAIRALLPQGWTISEEMMMPLHETARNQVAAKFALTSALSAAQTAISQGVVNVNAGSTDPVATGGQGVSTDGKGKSNKVAIGLGAVAAVAAIGFGVYLTRKPAAALPAKQPDAASAVASDTAPPATSPPPATVAAPPAPVDKTPRRVKVVIMPPDASIEIEGVKAIAKSGLLEITGTLGSVHRVKVFKGKNETITDVIVTEAGPSPPKIELTFGGKPGASGTAGPAAPPNKPGIIKQFE